MATELGQDTAKAMNLKAIAGVDKHLGDVTEVTIHGVSYTPDALKAVFQGEIDADMALDQARAVVMQLLAAARVARGNARDMRRALRTYLIHSFGPQAVGVLGDFGMSPKPRSVPDTAVKAEAANKARATRNARHIMGKKQRKAIKVETSTPSEPKP